MPSINQIIGVYHADGGLVGELKYMTGKIIGTSHCSLCDITHTSAGEKTEWKTCEKKIGIPVKMLHLNERDEAVKKFTDNKTPCVIGKISNEYIMLINNKELKECSGNVELFEKKLSNKINF